jgi:fructose-1,6-bisphosphatase/inositol monophosphatase family enzyme
MTDDQLKQAQAVIVQQFQAVRPKLIETFGIIEELIKEDATPVTVLDKWVEEQLRLALRKFDPGIGIVGEELGQEGDQNTFWLIDPIDDTESFIRGLPFSLKGQGSLKNGQLIHCSRRPLKRCWIELAAPLSDSATFPVLSAVSKLVNGYRVVGDFTLVAEGKIDAKLSYHASGGDWDYAPQMLLLKEAGAKVANLGSEGYDYRNHDFLASSPAVFDQLIEAINNARQDS